LILLSLISNKLGKTAVVLNFVFYIPSVHSRTESAATRVFFQVAHGACSRKK